MSEGVSPIRSLDFEAIQIQIQLAPLTVESLARHQEAETRRIRDRLRGRPTEAVPKAVLIVDASCSSLPSAAVRKAQGDWFNANRELLRLVVDSMACVLPNDLIRGALKAVTWVAPMPFEITSHATLELALDWAIARVTKHGGAIPNELLLGGVDAIERHRIAAEAEFSRAATRDLTNHLRPAPR